MSHAQFRTLGRSIRSIEDPALRKFLESIAHNIDLFEEDIRALEEEKKPEWLDLSMVNSWTRYSVTDFPPPQFYKDSAGIVRLRGLVSSGITTIKMCTLPEGYRPEFRRMFPAVSNNGSSYITSRVDVLPDGQVIPMVAGNTFLSLDSIQFPAYEP